MSDKWRWKPEEAPLIETCISRSVPYSDIGEVLGVGRKRLERRVSWDGLTAVKDLRRQELLDAYAAKYVPNGIEMLPNSRRYNWTRSHEIFIRKCYLSGIRAHDVAEVLGVGWRTVNVRYYRLTEYRDRFRKRYARFIYHLFMVSGSALDV